MHLIRPVIFSLLGTARAQNELGHILQKAGFNTLYKAIDLVPGLLNKLEASDHITVLAPTDAAFAALEPGTPEYAAVQSQDVKALEALLSYHVIAESVFIGNNFEPNTASVDKRTAPVFFPTLLTSQDKFDGATATEVSGGQNVGLVIASDATLALSGELQTSKINPSDMQGKKGLLVHTLHEVLRVPRTPSETAEDFGLSALVGALTATTLASTVDDAKDLTIFAPVNAAFEAIGSVLASANTQTLQSVLENHVVSGSVVFSTDVKDETVKSYGGEDLTLSVIDDTVFIDTARVVIPNILTSNGVVHVVDSVLNPDAKPVNRASLKPNGKPTPAFSGASSVMATPFASSAPSATTTVEVPPVATSAPAVAAVKAGSSSSGEKSSTNAAGRVTSDPLGALFALGVLMLAAVAL